MTAGEILEIVDAIKENTMPDSVKLRFINEIEGRVLCEIHKKMPNEICDIVSENDELSVPSPYANIYSLYLISMIDFATGNFDGYVRSCAECESAFSEYARFCIRNRSVG